MGRLRRLRTLKGRAVMPEPTLAIDLPDLAGRGVKRSEPPTAPAIGVDADEMTQIENFAVLERRVSDDRRLARHVRPGSPHLQRLPAHGLPMLFGKSPLGLVVGVGKKMRTGFVEIAPGANVLDVLAAEYRPDRIWRDTISRSARRQRRANYRAAACRPGSSASSLHGCREAERGGIVRASDKSSSITCRLSGPRSTQSPSVINVSSA